MVGCSNMIGECVEVASSFCRLCGESAFHEFDFVAETISRFEMGSLEMITKNIAHSPSSRLLVSSYHSIDTYIHIRPYWSFQSVPFAAIPLPPSHKLLCCLLSYEVESWCVSGRQRFMTCCKCRPRICGVCPRTTKYVGSSPR